MFKLLLLSTLVFAQDRELRRETYEGVARRKDGVIAYYEQHEAFFEQENIRKAKTTYLDADKKVFAEMSSDFQKKVTLPEYEFKDTRDQSSHGIRIKNDQVILWRKKGEGPPEEKTISTRQFKKEDFIVGCQGLHYYLISNLDEVKKRRSISIKYMMPGALDFYSFTLRVKNEDEKNIYLSLSVDNIFLKIFVSSLDLTYTKSNRRLIRYSGLSNIPDTAGKNEFVTIDYQFQEKAK